MEASHSAMENQSIKNWQTATSKVRDRLNNIISATQFQWIHFILKAPQ